MFLNVKGKWKEELRFFRREVIIGKSYLKFMKSENLGEKLIFLRKKKNYKNGIFIYINGFLMIKNNLIWFFFLKNIFYSLK